ncbi:MAG: gluconate 2-dehydrogenase subunit 3 family protein [Myxococcota bacterium]
MDRRTFLKYGVVGGALLVVGGSGLALWKGALTFTPRRALRVMDDLAFNVTAAAAQAVVSVPDADAAELAHRVDEQLEHTTPEARTDFLKMTRALNSPLLGLILDGRPTPFLALDVSSRAQVLRQWGRSGLEVRRQAYHSMRKLCASAYYVDKASWLGIGYPGPPNLALVETP